ncbi:MAG TPA: DNA translocase FtsK 4TM domain-containing protein [Xanthobacteraceae bacterium]|jgi:S-DNA-T family DNA segregation ATPase FtsK/SpoIIIE|nr:DNA translocase FtsK 4TM domain-containing protein [Xanthobacteraceae bacterium]
MSMIDGIAALSGQFGGVLQRRLREVGGIALLALAMMAALALATWSVQDPSLSHATDTQVHNLLGSPGAIAADLMMQLFGLGSLALLLPIAVWGYRLLGHRALSRERLRVMLWLGGAVLAAAFASCLPRTAHWPLPSGLGGVIGDAMLRLPDELVHAPLVGANRFAAAFILGAGALFAFAGAAGMLWSDAIEDDDYEEPEEEDAADEEEAGDEGWISLGFIAHHLMSLRARLMLLLHFRQPPTAVARAEGAMPRRRVEPRFDPSAERTPLVPDDEDDEGEAADAAPRAPRKPKAPKPRRSGSRFVLPPLELLAQPSKSGRATVSADTLQANSTALEGVLGDFGVRGEIINARPGPVVTLYELEPAPGIKSSRVISLADDIARSMSALSARVAVVSGRNAIGIELPNPTREKVFLRELLAARDYVDSNLRLALGLGKSIGGEAVLVDLARMPHLLIAGTTGSGKSVAINTMILSLLYRLRPDQCRLIMVDPKMLELSVYDGIPHLLTPVVTDPKKAVVALKWAVREMEERYKKMSKLGVRNIDGYNARVAEANSKGEKLSRTVHTGYNRDTGEAIYENEELDLEPLPYIVVIVDEMADLMMVAGKDIEGAVQRLAQMARAAGLHVILATQRPSVDVITGTIKANFPTRISFQVTSKIDSRTILGEQGAEQLLGQGDMLYMAGGGRISRVHGPFVSDEEVEKVVRHLKAQGQPEYLEAVTAEEPQDEDGNPIFDSTAMGGAEGGDLYAQAVQIVTRDRKASTSYIQRRLQIGYNRAASLMERMEQEGVVGQPNHAGKREILVEGAQDDPF